MTEWRVQINDDDYANNLFDVEITDALNRFGRFAIAYIDDSGGEEWSKYPRGTRLDFEYSEDGETWTRRFSGYVVERKESDRGGDDSLEVEAYSFDHFLRRNTNQQDLSGETISSALQILIEDYTPVTWDATQVSVTNDETISRSYRGEKVDLIIENLSNKSADEEFGVDNNIDFFFRPRNTTQAERDIDNSQWLDYDLPERGKEAVNEVVVYYNDGNDSVVVDDGTDKQQLEDTLGTPNPVTLQQEAKFDDITTESAAKEKAEQILSDRSTTLSGTVTTYGLLNTSPGDVIEIEIVERGLNEEFRIAAIEYRWGKGETILTVRENRGGQDDKLIRMVERLDRVEMRNADRDAVPTRFIEPDSTQVDFVVTVDVIIRRSGDGRFIPGFGRTNLGFGRENLGFDSAPDDFIEELTTRVTNTLRDSVRDAWKGDTPPSIDTVALGDGTGTPSQTDTSLDNQVASTTTTSLNRGSNGARFNGTITFTEATTIAEAGLFDGSNLHSRSTIEETTVDPNLPVDIIYTINSIVDTSGAGVLNTEGQATIADILTNDTPDTPTDYAFGSDGTQATVDDTSLNNELSTIAIDRFETGQTGVVSAFARLAGTSLEGETLAEMGVKDSTGQLLTRVTFADIVKETGQEIEGRNRLVFDND